MIDLAGQIAVGQDNIDGIQVKEDQRMTDRQTIVGLGEVLWDVFPDGEKFGGAPANFACSVAELAGNHFDVRVVSAVGSDDLGQRAITTLHQHHVTTENVVTCGYPTGTVLVSLDGAGHASYTFAANTAWDNMEWTDALHGLASKTQAVCFGTLGQRESRSRATIRQFVRATPPTALRVFDVNLRPPFWTAAVVTESLELANVVKLNDTELPVVAELCHISGSDEHLLRTLMTRFSLRAIALTRGTKGALLMDAGGSMSDLPAELVQVIDTVGAGDAYTAALVIGLLRNIPLDRINAWGIRVAAFVCTQAGATPHFPLSFKEMLRDSH